MQQVLKQCSNIYISPLTIGTQEADSKINIMDFPNHWTSKADMQIHDMSA